MDLKHRKEKIWQEECTDVHIPVATERRADLPEDVMLIDVVDRDVTKITQGPLIRADPFDYFFVFFTSVIISAEISTGSSSAGSLSTSCLKYSLISVINCAVLCCAVLHSVTPVLSF